MPPSDFIQARNSCSDDRGVVVMVDGQPYLPTVHAVTKDQVAAAVVAVLGLLSVPPPQTKSNNHNNNHNNNNHTKLLLDKDKEEEEEESSLLRSLLTVEEVTGGLSNTLYRVSGLRAFQEQRQPTIVHNSSNNEHNNSNPHNNNNNNNLWFPHDDILVRIFGAAGMIDRDVETSTFAYLATAGHAPAYYGRFANGRLEGWMQGMRPLDTVELRQTPIVTAVARQLARLHTQFQIPAPLQRYYQQPSMWVQLKDWHKQALQNNYQTDHDRKRAATLHLERLADDEFAWLQNDKVLPHNAAVVYCHNDVLAANILYQNDNEGKLTTSNNDLQLIDFEYGGLNYRAFDVANHWNEYAGGPPNVTCPRYDWLPNAAQQTLFCRTYLETAAVADQEKTKSTNGGKVVITDEQVQTLRREVQAFLLPNHLYWGLWAINQAALEGCEEYDYMLYGMERFKQYRICKQEWLSLSSSSSSSSSSSLALSSNENGKK